MNTTNVFYFVYLLLLLVSSVPAKYMGTQPKDRTCDDIRNEMAQNFDKMTIVLDDDLKEFPSKEDFIRNFCDPFEAWIPPWEEYMKCLNGNLKTLFTLVFNTIKKNHQTMCSGRDKTDLAYGHLRCLNQRTIPEVKETSTKMKALFEFIATFDDPEDIIPYLCCGQINMVKFATARYHRTCRLLTGCKTGAYFDDLAHSPFSFLLDITCGELSTIEGCNEFQPEITEEVLEVMKNATTASDTLIESFLTIISQLK